MDKVNNNNKAPEIYLGFESLKEQNFQENLEAILTMQIEIDEGNEKILIKTTLPVEMIKQHLFDVLDRNEKNKELVFNYVKKQRTLKSLGYNNYVDEKYRHVLFRFIDILIDDKKDIDLLTPLSKLTNAITLGGLVKIITEMSVKKGNIIPLLTKLIRNEFEQNNENATLRGTTFATAIQNQYIQNLEICQEYKKSVMISIIKIVALSKDVMFEIAPAKKDGEVEKMKNLLVGTCEAVLTKLLSQGSINSMPRPLRYLCSLMGKLEEEFMNSKKNLLVSGFIILRYFSPSFTDPTKYVDDKELLTSNVKANLTVVARIIQKLAAYKKFNNLGSEKVDGFIEQYTPNLETYLTEIRKDPLASDVIPEWSDLATPVIKEVDYSLFSKDDFLVLYNEFSKNTKFMSLASESKSLEESELKIVNEIYNLNKEIQYINQIHDFATIEDSTIGDLTNLKAYLNHLSSYSKNDTEEVFQDLLKKISNFLQIHISILESLDTKIDKWIDRPNILFTIGGVFFSKNIISAYQNIVKIFHSNLLKFEEMMLEKLEKDQEEVEFDPLEVLLSCAQIFQFFINECSKLSFPPSHPDSQIVSRFIEQMKEAYYYSVEEIRKVESMVECCRMELKFKKNLNLLKFGSKFLSSDWMKYFENKNFENSNMVDYFLFTDFLVLTQKSIDNNEENRSTTSMGSQGIEKTKVVKRNTEPLQEMKSRNSGSNSEEIQSNNSLLNQRGCGTHRVVERISLFGAKITVLNSIKNGVKLETANPKNEYFFEFRSNKMQLQWIEEVSCAMVSSTTNPTDQFVKVNSPFPEFEKNDLQFLIKFVQVKKFKRGELIVKEGEKSDFLYRVENGSVCAKQSVQEKPKDKKEKFSRSSEVGIFEFLQESTVQYNEDKVFKYNLDLIKFQSGDFFNVESLLEKNSANDYVAESDITEVSFYIAEKVSQDLKFRHSTAFKLWNKVCISFANSLIGLRYLHSQKIAFKSGKALKPLTFEEQVFLLLSAISELERKALNQRYDNEAIINIITGSQVSRSVEKSFGGKSKIEELNCFGSAKQMDFHSLMILMQKLEVEKLIKINSVTLTMEDSKKKILQYPVLTKNGLRVLFEKETFNPKDNYLIRQKQTNQENTRQRNEEFLQNFSIDGFDELISEHIFKNGQMFIAKRHLCWIKNPKIGFSKKFKILLVDIVSLLAVKNHITFTSSNKKFKVSCKIENDTMKLYHHMSQARRKAISDNLRMNTNQLKIDMVLTSDDNMSENDWKVILMGSKSVAFPKGDKIFKYQGEIALYRIARGSCTLNLQISGNTIEFGQHKEGDIVGIIDFFHPRIPQHLKPNIIVDSEELICYVLDPLSLERLFHLQPELGTKFCKYIACKQYELITKFLSELKNEEPKKVL